MDTSVTTHTRKGKERKGREEEGIIPHSSCIKVKFVTRAGD